MAHIKELSKTHKDIESFKQIVENIKEDIEISYDAQMVRFNNLEQTLKGSIKEEIRHSIKEELQNQIIRDKEKVFQESEVAIALQQKIYSIDISRRKVIGYDKDLKMQEILYETKKDILKLLYVNNRLLVAHTCGKICTLHQEEIIDIQGEKISAAPQGIIILTKERDLIYYSIESRKSIEIDKEVVTFQLLESGKVIYWLEDRIKSSYICIPK